MAAIASISNRLTTAQSQLLERTRIISLGMHPSAAATTQIVRALAGVKRELSRVADEAELERAGLVVGGGNRGRSSQLDEDERALDALGERYDRLVEMLGKDEDGRERAKALVREKREAPMVEEEGEEGEEEEMEDFAGSPRHSPPPPTQQPVRPFRDYDDEEEGGERAIMDQQQVMMNDQDERLTLLSHSINRQNDLSIQIGDELDRHHELLEDTDAAMDRTAARLQRARRRLDTVADGARQHGSTITIVLLILVLLMLIIIFKT
ncbi:hypothetical protein CC85DRAFT_284122 [Cutaneotrichosporon oleaginosum]|uniref:t-SNARE coiled-coil homology domain-containing protein n=1 Tax=Cutaneotrichosporon oleaginosum TaxID=879819 RepID=A0A0J0XRY6_9TREE|nr:uncharacterized protein CC85DRAFT_284122 [Cutaneotrichosporon oleaginosum]KLT43840.1 hypothetical protein CC85DRAFT_284122 [Cutaneotrichosporon oleaginosum]TXT06420.1 hypothetical protein COLE_05751 [Cutaneotrichosporon oleaginosum]